MSLFIAIFGLAFLILIHEAGHFVTALAVGMNPRKFYIGFPPAIAKVRRRGIEYGIGAIPLGGYVKIPGMHRPAASDLELHFQRAVTEAPELVGPLDRIRRALAKSNFDAARELLPELEAAVERAVLSPAAAAGVTRGLTDLADGLGKDAYWRAPTWKRVLVIFAGPGTNLLFAIVLFAILFMGGGGKPTTTVYQVVAGTPAAHAGLHAGDRIVEIDGHPVTPPEIPKVISGSHGRPLTLVVDRNGRIVTLGPVAPKKTSGAYRLGFVLKGKGLPPFAAAKNAVQLTGQVSWEIIRSVSRIVQASGRKQISSPVGIVQTSSAAVHQGFQTYLWVLAFISLSLALLNLLPLLPLDGGHIFFSLLEAVRRKAVPREIYERVSAVGIALVLLLFFIGLSNDIGRVGGG
jgi:regulator of sigma E protease